MLAEDGVVVDLVDGVAKIVGKVDVGYVFVDGTTIGDISEASMKDRRILGEEGFLSVIVVVDSVTGKVVVRTGDPRPRLRRGRDRRSTTSASRSSTRIDAADAPTARTDSYQLQQTVRRVVGRWVNRAHRRRPMIIPVVIEA